MATYCIGRCFLLISTLVTETSGGSAGAGSAQSGSGQSGAASQTSGVGATNTQASTEKTRSWTGLIAVVIGDVAILAMAIAGVGIIRESTGTSSSIVAILTSAFTAIGTLTTAYFGIRAAANTAQTSIAQSSTTPPPAAPTSTTQGSNP
jgi:hypothetical protein